MYILLEFALTFWWLDKKKFLCELKTVEKHGKVLNFLFSYQANATSSFFNNENSTFEEHNISKNSLEKLYRFISEFIYKFVLGTST